MKTLVISILGSILATLSYSQELHIYYDFMTDEVRYERNGESISRPKAKLGETVHLHVKEFNNYIYEMDFTMASQPADQPASGNINLGSIQGLLGQLNTLNDSSVSGSSMAGLDLGDINTDFFEDSALKESTRGSVANQLITEVNNTFLEIQESKAKIDQLVRQIREITKSIELIELSEQKLIGLKTNPGLKPSRIKALYQEYGNSVFGQEEESQIGLDQLLEYRDKPYQFIQLKQEIMEENGKMTQLAGLASYNLLKLRDLTIDNEAIANFHEEASGELEKTKDNQDAIEEYVDALQAPQVDQSINELYDLRVILEEVYSNDFTKNYECTITDDKLSINTSASLARKDSLGNTVQVKTKSFDIRSYGGIKVNASLGISFGHFFNKVESYYVNELDNTIAASDADAFYPIVTSFIHFYPNSVGQVSLGGTFGIGFPINSVEQVQAATFLLGPSLIVGTNERVILSAGIMGSKVSRLSEGLELGDILEGNGSIPTKDNYEYGFFAGLSFNLTGN